MKTKDQISFQDWWTNFGKSKAMATATVEEIARMGWEAGLLEGYSREKDAHELDQVLRNHIVGQVLAGLVAGCYAGSNSGFTVHGNVKAAIEYADVVMAQLNYPPAPK